MFAVFVLQEYIQIIVVYEPSLLFVNPVPCMSYLADIWKIVIHLPMFPVNVPHCVLYFHWLMTFESLIIKWIGLTILYIKIF